MTTDELYVFFCELKSNRCRSANKEKIKFGAFINSRAWDYGVGAG